MAVELDRFRWFSTIQEHRPADISKRYSVQRTTELILLQHGIMLVMQTGIIREEFSKNSKYYDTWKEFRIYLRIHSFITIIIH